MDKELRIVLAILAVALVICIGASIVVLQVARSFVTPENTADPVQAARIGHQILDYVLPPGYREQHASNAYGYKMVMIGAGGSITNGMLITLMEFPSWWGVQREGFTGQMEQVDEDEGDLDMRTVSTQTVTIRGQLVTIQMSESTEQGGLSYRQVWATFPGRGNSTVMFMAGGNKDNWDQEALDSFVASIR